MQAGLHGIFHQKRVAVCRSRQSQLPGQLESRRDATGARLKPGKQLGHARGGGDQLRRTQQLVTRRLDASRDDLQMKTHEGAGCAAARLAVRNSAGHSGVKSAAIAGTGNVIARRFGQRLQRLRHAQSLEPPPLSPFNFDSGTRKCTI